MKKLRKILLIDDEDVTCFLNKLLLDRMAVAQEVVTITDPWKALKFIIDNYYKQGITAEEGYDLIFLDINMPGMDGFAILDDMNALGIDKSNIAVVILTSSLSPEDKQKAALYGHQLQGYLVKPLRQEDVSTVIASLS